ncbi:hypothetical protein POM88_053258 [Heracleum sosnowskyi]|uniref:DUF7646 domain-containing protein n=1 Tax=Heracleum sosnowskyi TaxID=360622 RepID=A0AAD8LXB1_9APIA|nr:hypothetical protein POM88_053258 [Heracleum sosnowskyi]
MGASESTQHDQPNSQPSIEKPNTITSQNSEEDHTTPTPKAISQKRTELGSEIKPPPHNYEAIVKDAAIDKSSTEKLFQQLYTGVLLNQKKQKYWVDKKSHANCFIRGGNTIESCALVEVSYLKLLKKFSPKHFEPKYGKFGLHDLDVEEPVILGKRGQINDQLVELPLEHQVYDIIDAEGSKGLSKTELCKRLGLNNKRLKALIEGWHIGSDEVSLRKRILEMKLGWRIIVGTIIGILGAALGSSLNLASENPFKDICTALPKPDGGEYGKYYSLTALNDPRIGLPFLVPVTEVFIDSLKMLLVDLFYMEFL